MSSRLPRIGPLANSRQTSQRLRQTDTVVLSLFGRAASTPQYAIHEEDRLEWLHALLSDEASLPDWLAYQLKSQPMLFVGCEIPDWVGRFLLRMSSNTRLSLGEQAVLLRRLLTSKDLVLSSFFETFCRKAQVQQLEMEPTAFVAELRARWEEQRPKTRRRHAYRLTPPSGRSRRLDDLHQLHA